MSWKRMSAAIGVAAGVVFCLVYFNPSISYDDLSQAQSDIQKAGYFCTGDRADGNSNNGFIVSRKSIPWADANAMFKSGPMKKGWKDKVWITKNSSAISLETTPNNQAPRVWGRVLAFGDQQFLDEIEGELRRTRRFSWL